MRVSPVHHQMDTSSDLLSVYDEDVETNERHVTEAENHRIRVRYGVLGALIYAYRQVVRCLRHAWTGVRKTIEHESDELEMHVVRYKPDGLDALCRNTKFTKKELQLMYRGFKNECPSGIVNEETFKSIYAQFFPQGDVNHYAEYVFKTFDHDHSGAISFEDFVVGLSVLSRGSLHEKLQWTFNLYDINGDGFITKDELYDIVTSIYDLMGNKCAESNVEEAATRDHVERVFQRLDLNKDGVVTMDEFMDSLSKDNEVVKSLSNLDTVL